MTHEEFMNEVIIQLNRVRAIEQNTRSLVASYRESSSIMQDNSPLLNHFSQGYAEGYKAGFNLATQMLSESLDSMLSECLDWSKDTINNQANMESRIHSMRNQLFRQYGGTQARGAADGQGSESVILGVDESGESAGFGIRKGGEDRREVHAGTESRVLTHDEVREIITRTEREAKADIEAARVEFDSAVSVAESLSPIQQAYIEYCANQDRMGLATVDFIDFKVRWKRENPIKSESTQPVEHESTAESQSWLDYKSRSGGIEISHPNRKVPRIQKGDDSSGN